MGLSLVLSVEVFAGSPAQDSTQRKSYASLFAEILSDLPPENRAKVDSAAVPRPAVDEAAASKAKESREGEQAAEANQKGLETLPVDIRERVEKAVVNLEERKKKGLDFKELRR